MEPRKVIDFAEQSCCCECSYLKPIGSANGFCDKYTKNTVSIGGFSMFEWYWKRVPECINDNDSPIINYVFKEKANAI